MTAVGAEVQPTALEDPAVASYHECKYRCFILMAEDQRAYREVMQQGMRGEKRATG